MARKQTRRGIESKETMAKGTMAKKTADSKILMGDLTAKPGVIYEYEEITGNLIAAGADDGAFDHLTTVGGDADFQGCTGSVPKLTTVGGNAYFQGWTGSAPKLTTVGGSAYFQGWTGSAPKLTTVGGSADFQRWRSEEHTSELQSLTNLVCRL